MSGGQFNIGQGIARGSAITAACQPFTGHLQKATKPENKPGGFLSNVSWSLSNYEIDWVCIVKWLKVISGRNCILENMKRIPILDSEIQPLFDMSHVPCQMYC